MAPPVTGFGGTLGFGVESTWGTAVARTNWKSMSTMALRRMLTREVEPELGRFGQTSTIDRNPYLVSDFAGGPISYPVCYDDSSLLMLGHQMGAVDTVDADPVFTHTFTLASPVPTGLTIEAINGRGNGVFTGMTETFEGCKFNGFKWTMSAGGVLMCDTEIIGQTSSGLGAAGTPSYSGGGEVIKHHHLQSVSLGATALAVTGFTIEVVRGLNRNHELGSAYTSEPWEQGLEINIELRAKWQVATFDSLLLSGAFNDLVIPLTGTGVKAATITAHNCQVWDVSRDVTSKGAIDQIIKLRAFGDGTDQGLAIAIVNGNSSDTAN